MTFGLTIEEAFDPSFAIDLKGRYFLIQALSRGLRVNVVSLGPIPTPLHRKLAPTDADREAMSTFLKSRFPPVALKVLTRSPKLSFSRRVTKLHLRLAPNL